MTPEPVVPIENTFDALYGLKLLDSSDGLVTAEVPVTDAVRQPLGLVHGGVYASISEAIASIGTYNTVGEEGKVGIGLSNSTNFLRPLLEGTIHARASARHRGRTTWVWDVDITDDQGRLCATSRVTIAVRDLPKA